MVLKSLARRVNAADPGALNNLGVLYVHKGLIDDAIAALERALELDPRMQVAQRNLEIALRQSGFYDRRVAELQERLRAAPDDRSVRWELAKVYTSLGQHDAAVAEFRALADRYPDDAGVLVQLALVEKLTGRLDAASDWLERAASIEPDSSVVHFYLGETLYHRGLASAALEPLERAIALNQENADAHYLLAFVLGDLGRHEDARSAAKRAVQLNPALARAQANLTLERPLGVRRSSPRNRAPDSSATDAAQSTLAHYNLGRGFRQHGYHAEALREYRLALDRGEDRRLVLQAMAEVQLLRRDFAAALELYDRLLGDTPEAPKLWNERGVVLLQLNRSGEAIDAYHRALELAPGHALARNNLAVTHALTGRHEDALYALRDAIKERPDLPIPRLNLGLLLLKLRRFQLSMQAYQQLLEQDSFAPAWNGVGVGLMELGRAADARGAFTRAVEADPASAEAHYNLSFALSSLGDYDASLREVTRAQELDPYYVPQKFRLAIDLQYEDPTIAVVPDISTDVTGDLAAQRLTLDDAAIERMIRELERPRARRPSASFGDPFALARDYLAKGLLELASADVNRALGRGGAPADGHVLSGDIEFRRGLTLEALERYRAARGLDAARPDARLGEIRALLKLGRAAEAGTQAESLAAERPDDVDALLVLAQARLSKGDPGGAMQALGSARSRAPHRADVLKLQGDIAVGFKDFDTAKEAYQAAAAVDPRFVQVRVDLGRVFEAQGDGAGAERCFREALDVLPTHHEATLALAGLYRRRGNPKGAVNLLVEMLGADSSNLDAMVALGHALMDDNRPAPALEVFRQALAVDQRHVPAHFFIGAAFARLQRYPEAVAAWEQVIKLDPSGSLATEARKHSRTAQDLARIFRPEAA